MSKVTYLLGAGASCGNWCGTDSAGLKRGVPVINKFSDALNKVITDLNLINRDAFLSHSDITSLSSYEIEQLVHVLKYLKEKCDEYPTIDSFVKQIYINPINDFDNWGISSYKFVKKILSAFLYLIQDIRYRDSRYDGFISSVILDNGTFPPMNILSWNYDAQFEMAFAGYMSMDKNVENIWNELNVLNKTYIATDFDINKKFGLIKLNGTAFFVNRNELCSTYKGEAYSKIFDYFWKDNQVDRYAVAHKLIFSNNYESTISYVWEEDRLRLLFNDIKERVKDTEELIVIGYSFPYVNRVVDTIILQYMTNLKTIHIQDPAYEDIKERIESMVDDVHDFIKFKQHLNLSQFYIPNHF